MSDDTTTPGDTTPAAGESESSGARTLPPVETLPALLPGGMPRGVDRLSDLGTLLTLREAADALGVSTKTARRMITRGDLKGAHQVPMPSGRGTQWVVPYSSVVEQERDQREQVKADPQSDEIAALRDKVTRLESDLALSRALADERAHALEQLHLTVRLALNAAPEPRRSWWRRGKARTSD
jgi:predicted DNA-binding transcriptional regulator YafY